MFLDLREVVARPGGDNGMFGLAFHPKFRENREFFVIYIDRRLPKSTGVSRFRSSADDPEKPRLGPKDSKIISPGDPKRSELFLCMNHRGPGQMPNLATSFVDEKAAREIAAWIESLSAAR